MKTAAIVLLALLLCACSNMQEEVEYVEFAPSPAEAVSGEEVLEQRLQDTLNGMEEIDASTVDIAETVAVELVLAEGRSLSSEQEAAIRKLVAACFPEMEQEDVSVTIAGGE